MKAIQVIKLSIGLSLCFVIPSFAVNVTIPETSAGPGSTGFKIPIMVDDVTGLGIISYQFTVSFNGNVLDATGASTSGTISSSWGVPTVNTSVDSEITVVIYGTLALSGSGVLIYLIFDVVGNPGDSTNQNFTKFIFNEGNPTANVSGGLFTISEKPDVVDSEYNTLPKDFLFSQNYPNPFNSETIIQYQLPKKSWVVIKVFNLLGQEMRTLVNEEKQPGYFTAHWDGKNNFGKEVSSGIYLYRIEARHFIKTKKMVKLK